MKPQQPQEPVSGGNVRQPADHPTHGRTPRGPIDRIFLICLITGGILWSASYLLKEPLADNVILYNILHMIAYAIFLTGILGRIRRR